MISSFFIRLFYLDYSVDLYTSKITSTPKLAVIEFVRYVTKFILLSEILRKSTDFSQILIVFIKIVVKSHIRSPR